MRRALTIATIVIFLVSACSSTSTLTPSPSANTATNPASTSPAPSPNAQPSPSNTPTPSTTPSTSTKVPGYCDKHLSFTEEEYKGVESSLVAVVLYKKIFVHSAYTEGGIAGTGIARNGYILTAAHVVKVIHESKNSGIGIMISYFFVNPKTHSLVGDGTDADVVYYNEKADVAILKPRIAIPGMADASRLQVKDVATLPVNAQLCAYSTPENNWVEAFYYGKEKTSELFVFTFPSGENTIPGSSGGPVYLFENDHFVIVGMVIARGVNPTNKMVGAIGVNITDIIALVKKDAKIDLS